MEQTAVDYLLKEISVILGPLETKPMQDLLMVDAINKAKEMEKQQLIDATTRENVRCTQIANDTLKVLGIEPLFMVDNTWGEHYYNNTFEND